MYEEIISLPAVVFLSSSLSPSQVLRRHYLTLSVHSYLKIMHLLKTGILLLGISSIIVGQGPGWTCGGEGGYICRNDHCCSHWGSCGSTDEYCLASQGCQTTFGRCEGDDVDAETDTDTETDKDTDEPEASELNVSTDGRCGRKFGTTCLGSDVGDCCSQNGYWLVSQVR
jgi:hypothetical protein